MCTHHSDNASLPKVTREVNIYKGKLVAVNKKFFQRFIPSVAVGALAVATGGTALFLVAAGMVGVTIYERKSNISHLADIDELPDKIRQRRREQRDTRTRLEDLQNRLRVVEETRVS